MSTILEKIADIENEMARTQKNKATASHLGMLKAKLAKLRYILSLRTSCTFFSVLSQNQRMEIKKGALNTDYTHYGLQETGS